MIYKNVIIAALTYRRPMGLAKLLEHINGLTVPQNVIVEILIVDNAPDNSAAEHLKTHARNARFRLHMVHAKERGIAHARNHILDFVRPREIDYLMLIDDDEYPSQNWLAEMLDAFDLFNTDAVIGPVIAHFDMKPSRWISQGSYFDFGGYQNGADLIEGNTSNAAIKVNFIRTHRINFDRKFDFTGGEDTQFFDTFLRLGGKIKFAKKAVVVETIVPNRSTISWLMKRWMRTGNTNAIIARSNGKSRMAIFGAGIARIAIGTIWALPTALIAPFGKPQFLIQNLRLIARGVGFVCEAFHIQIEEYKTVTR